MSGQHRGLPPPAAMALPPQQAPPNVHPMPPPHHGNPSQVQSQHLPQSQGPPGHHIPHGHPVSDLPTPTSQWQEESLRNWLQAKSETERTKQEEEKTKQENIRLEQRKLEVDMLQHSLRGGIPPAMIPLVFAGMGRDGQLPQAVMDWAQQFMQNPQGHLPQLLPPQPISPHHQREHSGGHGHYAPNSAVSSVHPPGQAPPGFPQRSSSPNRSRPLSIGHPMPGAPGINTSFPPSHQGSSHMGGQLGQDASPGIYFHHWQPPTGPGSTRPGSPSGDPPKKRKATGPQSTETPTEQRQRSPPPFSHNPAHRRGHKRQKSDMSWHQSTSSAQDRGEERLERPSGPNSPTQQPRPPLSRERSRSEVGKHSVSSLLSSEPNEAKDEHSRPWPGTGHTPSHRSPTESEPRPAHGSYDSRSREPGN